MADRIIHMQSGEISSIEQNMVKAEAGELEW